MRRAASLAGEFTRLKRADVRILHNPGSRFRHFPFYPDLFP
jgi:hypothetical protein